MRDVIEHFYLLYSSTTIFPDLRKRLVPPLVTMVLSNCIVIIIPVIAMQIIDSIKNLSNLQSEKTLGLLFIVWFGSIILVVGFDYYQGVVLRKYSLSVVHRIFGKIFNVLKQKEFTFFIKNNIKIQSESMKRNLEDIIPLFDGTAYIVIRHVIILVATVIIMLVVNYKLMLAISIVFPLYIVSIFIHHKRVKSQYWFYRGTDADFLKQLIEQICCVPSYRLYGSFEVARQALTNQYHKLQAAHMDFYLTMLGRRMYLKLLSSVIPVYLMVVAYVFIRSEMASYGQIVGFWALFTQASLSLNGIASQYTHLLKALSVFQKIKPELYISDFKTNSKIRIGRILRIETQNVSYQYTRTRKIEFPDIQIRQGERICITGSSGCGKTTFLKILLGQLQPATGLIHINDTIRSEITETDFCQLIGYVEQNGFLYSATIKQNILLGREYNSEKWQKAIALSGLNTLLCKKNIHPAYKIGESGIQISGGERQRILLARALYHQPQWLFLDEPFSGIDPETIALIERMLSALCPEMTLILVSHDRYTRFDIDRTINLDQSSG